MINIKLDYNERGSARANALALAIGKNQDYTFLGFSDLPVDCIFSNEADQKFLVELKEIEDFWQSKSTGHLGAQVISMIESGCSGMVAVFGTLQEVLENVPKVAAENGKPTRRSGKAVAQDINTARAFCADAMSCNVPVQFLSSKHEMAWAWILSLAKHSLSSPRMAVWLPRFPVDPAGYSILCSIHGIGHEAAMALLQEHGRISEIMVLSEDELADTKVNGRRLGPAKASLIINAFGREE